MLHSLLSGYFCRLLFYLNWVYPHDFATVARWATLPKKRLRKIYLGANLKSNQNRRGILAQPSDTAKFSYGARLREAMDTVHTGPRVLSSLFTAGFLVMAFVVHFSGLMYVKVQFPSTCLSPKPIEARVQKGMMVLFFWCFPLKEPRNCHPHAIIMGAHSRYSPF